MLITFTGHPDQLAACAAELGDRQRGHPAHAVDDADVVDAGRPLGRHRPGAAGGGSLAGKVVVDTTNQFGAGPMRRGRRPDGGTSSTRRDKRACYVRAFNTLTSGFQADASGWRGDERAVLFLCGDFGSQRIVSTLIEDAGFAAVDLGSNADAAVMEPAVRVRSTARSTGSRRPVRSPRRCTTATRSAHTPLLTPTERA